MIDPDAGPARWQLLAVAGVILLLIVVMSAAMVAPGVVARISATPYVAPASAYPWQVGHNAVISVDTWAQDAAGPNRPNEGVCQMQAGDKGAVIELGGPLSDPRGYVELRTPRCTGWVSIYRIERP